MIYSLLDNDFYKFKMQKAVAELYPNVNVKYKFINRGNNIIFDSEMLFRFKEKIDLLCNLKFKEDEISYLNKKLGGKIDDYYYQYLKTYRFDKNNIDISNCDGYFNLEINGKWLDVILYEVPLMALITETYYEDNLNYVKNSKVKAYNKIRALSDNCCYFAIWGQEEDLALMNK